MRLLSGTLLLLFPLFAQTPPAAPPAAGTVRTDQQPADIKAYSEAASLKDPPQKAAALKKFLNDYPNSRAAQSAQRQLISALIATRPEDAVAQVKAFEKSMPAPDAAALYRQLGADLKAANKLPNEAEKAVRRALKLYAYAPYAAQAKAEATKETRPAPSEAVLKSRYQAQRASYVEAVADMLSAKGNSSKAQKLYREALQANPALNSSAQALADAAAKAGRKDEALGYYAQSMLARTNPESRKKFYDAWIAAKGSLSGAEEYLDQRHKQLFPLPIAVTPYQKQALRTNRVVLAEVYTGSGCPPCAGADVAFDAVLERYSRSDVAVVMYHEHIPRPDPMANTDTISRWKWQQGRGVPTYAVDGAVSNRGGGARSDAPEIESLVRASIENDLLKPAGAQLSLKAAQSGGSVQATAVVSEIAKPNANLVLQLVLVEKEIRYSGENSIRFHPMVARAIHTVELKNVTSLSAAHAFSIDAVTAALKKHLDDFEKHDDRHNKDGKFRFMERKDTIDPAHLAVIAFIQDSKTREVLQAAYAETR
ncbi:MAG: tetratricopeptide repeat protein [Acidobacteria bacterium]|nr:tetratricopeptide repeat protein [Acidobacteriota bacterium]